MSNPKTDPGKKRKTQPGTEKPIVAIGDGFTWDPPEDMLDKEGNPIDKRNFESTHIVRERTIPRDGPMPIPQSLLDAARRGVQPGMEPIEVKDESLPPRAPSNPPKLADDTDESPRPSSSQALQQLVNEELVKAEEEKLFQEPVRESDMPGFLKEKTDVDGEPAPPVSRPPVPMSVLPNFIEEPEGFLEHAKWLLKFPVRAFRFLQNVGNAGLDAASALEMAQRNRSALSALKFTVETEKQANQEGFTTVRNEVLIAEQNALNAVNKIVITLEHPDTKPAKFKDVWVLGRKLISQDENLALMISALVERQGELEDTLEKLKRTYFANPENIKNMMSQLKKRDELRYDTAQKMEAFEARFGALITQAGLTELFVNSALPQIKQLIEAEGNDAWSKLADKFFGEMDKFAAEWKVDMAKKLEEARIATARAKEDLMAVKEGSEIFVPLAKNAVQEAHDLTMALTKKIEEARALKLDVQAETEVADEPRTMPDFKLARKNAFIVDDDDAFDDGPTLQEKLAEFEAEAEEVLPVTDAPASPPPVPPPPPPEAEKPVEVLKEEPKKIVVPQVPLTELAKAMNPPLFSKRTRNSLISAALISMVLVLIGIKGPQWFAHKTESNAVRVPQAEALEVVVPDAAAESPMSEAPQAEPEQVEPPREEARAEEVPPKREEKARRPPKRKRVVDEFDDIGLPPGIRTKKGGSR